MATATDSSSPTNSASTWALPLAATILVAGSLAFWTVAGVVWLATRPAPPTPVVVYLPPGAQGGWCRAEGEPPVRQPSVGSLRSATATRRNGTEAVPYRKGRPDAQTR